ncbi:ATP-binding protein [Deinococcus ficus]|uniref:ATP-binding protein n=1 Tax=Deinococcus ficus TaxID=317577 RepID=A0A221T3K4_9DEIO|nr:ATP-binding protein [Deinococcus ficus]ASN83446.1 ATP-binding protein [Deinococcus ficus]
MTLTEPPVTLQPFTIATALLKKLVTHQATTIERAIAEAVMNAVDAGASAVDVDLSPTELHIRDNGRGLTQKEEIEKYFAVFGFDHDTADEQGKRQYGEFGMGRAQLFKFGRVTWRTGHHKLTVDIHAHGMAYTHEERPRFQPGVHIHVVFNEADHITKNFDGHLKALRTHFQFLDTPVTVNGQPCRVTMDWDDEDDLAYYKVTSRGETFVFNKGVLVQSFWGNGGYVLSKVPLQVNITRTAVLPVHLDRIRAKISRIAARQRRDKLKLTDDEKRQLLAEMQYMKVDDWSRHKLVHDVTGSKYTLMEFVTEVEKRRVLSMESMHGRGDPYADMAHQHRQAFVLQRGMLSVYDCDSLQRWFETVQDILRLQLKDSPFALKQALEQLSRVTVEGDIQKAVPKLNVDHVLVERSKWTPFERLVMRALNTPSAHWESAVSQALRAQGDRTTLNKRELVLGESATAAGWTDGRSFIAIERRQLKQAKEGLPGFVALGALILHEYTHRGDSKSALHDADFYQTFHDAAMRLKFGQAVEKAHATYLRYKDEPAYAAGKKGKGQAAEPEPDAAEGEGD